MLIPVTFSSQQPLHLKEIKVVIFYYMYYYCKKYYIPCLFVVHFLNLVLNISLIEGLKGIEIGKAVSTIEINQKRTKNCALKST